MPYEHPTPLPPGVAVTPNKPVEPKQTKKAVARRELKIFTHDLTGQISTLAALIRRGWLEEAADILPEIRANLEQLETQLRN